MEEKNLMWVLLLTSFVAAVNDANEMIMTDAKVNITDFFMVQFFLSYKMDLFKFYNCLKLVINLPGHTFPG